MTPECSPAVDALTSVLRVLERIEVKLEKQEQRGKSLEKQEKEKTDHLHQIEKVDYRRRTQSLSENISTVDLSLPSTVPYSIWQLGNPKPHQILDLELLKVIESQVGDYWKIPDDGRLPLKSFKITTHGQDDGGEKPASYSRTKRQIERDSKEVRQFDDALRIQPGNDFLIVDHDSRNNARLYRVGAKAIGSQLRVEYGHSQSAPWSRIILYQGMTTGDSIDPQRRQLIGGLSDPIPYFQRGIAGTGLWSHIFSHLQLKQRNTTVNPYANPGAGFHTTFYDIREGKDTSVNELWKHGPLYDHPLGWSFRKCAYTLYTPTPMFTAGDNDGLTGRSPEKWTMLVLAPNHFFNEHNTAFPMKEIPPERAQSLGHRLGRLTQLGAEMSLIGQGLERIGERWADFQIFFDFILDSGDSLMNPYEHDNLLFDDGAFSRSRRYFWAIDCLSEFELCITDNLVQWELYKSARVQPLLDAELLQELDKIQLRNTERQYHILQNQREYFRLKLTSTKALRDALFTASAVIESRVSTRLSQNVKLLTFVSVFFLPLAFCTSLWSINDKFSSSALIYVVILVALSTYVVVFNMNSLIHTLYRLYEAKKKNVVRSMHLDSDERWQKCGQKFEAFRPKHENLQPSEWYVLLYAILRPTVILGFRREDKASRLEADIQSGSSSTGFFGIANRLSRRRQKPKDSWREDEGWVIESHKSA